MWDAVLEMSDVGLGNWRGECSKKGVNLQQTSALLQNCGQCIAMQLRLAFLSITIKHWQAMHAVHVSCKGVLCVTKVKLRIR